MAKYIDKAAVVAEIDDMLNTKEHTSHCDEDSFNSGRWKALTKIKGFLNTLEVKEVEEETESIWHDANQQPTMYRKYLVRYSDGRVSGSWERHDSGFIPWEDVIKEHGFTHWCYVEDLIKL